MMATVAVFATRSAALGESRSSAAVAATDRSAEPGVDETAVATAPRAEAGDWRRRSFEIDGRRN
jgi:hypothetical protein